MSCSSRAEARLSDTNIWIDFHHAALLNELFQLPFSLCCTDFVAEELDTPELSPLVELGLIVEAVDGDDVQQLFELAQQHRNPSLADMSCYFLAKKSGLPLLTGDGQLRRLAANEHVEVRGALWLLDQMVEHAVIEAHRAAEALRAMLGRNARLPAAECESRLARWEG